MIDIKGLMCSFDPGVSGTCSHINKNRDPASAQLRRENYGYVLPPGQGQNEHIFSEEVFYGRDDFTSSVGYRAHQGK